MVKISRAKSGFDNRRIRYINDRFLSKFCTELAWHDGVIHSRDNINEPSECEPALCPCFQLGPGGCGSS